MEVNCQSLTSKCKGGLSIRLSVYSKHTNGIVRPGF